MDNGNIQAQAFANGVGGTGLAGLANPQFGGRPDAGDAATLYATDPAWREAFKLALEEQRQEILNDQAAANAKAEEALRAIGDRYPIEPAGAPAPAKKTAVKPPSKTPLNDAAREAMALATVKLAGKDGIA